MAPKNLLAKQRHDVILESIRKEGSARVSELAERFDVSEMTVRRDLALLAEQNLIDKVHGGATRTGGSSAVEPGFEIKRAQQRAEKSAIAKAAADMVKPGAAIGLTAGTTTWRMAQLVTHIPDLTVVTNSPTIAQVFYQANQPELNVVITGGTRTPSDALVGPIATRSLEGLHVDLVFMGVHGMDTGLGFSTPNLQEAEVNRAFVTAAHQLVVLADHTKWSIRGLASFAALDEATVVISDSELPESARREFDEAGTDLVLTSPNGG